MLKIPFYSNLLFAALCEIACIYFCRRSRCSLTSGLPSVYPNQVLNLLLTIKFDYGVITLTRC